MTTNPLSPSAILERMADALPTHPQGDTTSDLSSSYEALALFTHACMISLGFRLLGFNEDTTSESDFTKSAPRLLAAWNNSVNSYSFVYAHTQSALRFVIKVDRLGGKAEIRGLAINDDRIARFELTARDYISSSALPVRIPLKEDGSDHRESEENRAALVQKLKDVMIAESRIADLASLLKINIIQKLLPSLQKEGYEETDDDRVAREDLDDSQRRPPRHPRQPQPGLPDPAQPYPFDDPLAAPPRRPVPSGEFLPPGFEDPYDIHRPPRGGLLQPGRTPFGNIGEDDLRPAGLGPLDPFRPSLGGGGLPRPGGNRGMHPTFDDPLFEGGGLGGGNEYDPQAPPGARWDPIGPGGQPRFSGGRPGGNRGPFGGGSGGFGGGFGGDII